MGTNNSIFWESSQKKITNFSKNFPSLNCQLTLDEKNSLLTEYPGLSEKIFKQTNPDKPILFKAKLGNGTFCSVSVGKFNNHYFAVRKIKSNLPNSFLRQEVMDMTKREMLIHEKLKKLCSNPHLLVAEKFIETVDQHNQPQFFQFMPIADLGNGNQLNKLIENSDLSEARKHQLFKTIVIQLCQTIFDLNKNSFYLRDIKPANILFSTKGTLFISDFGSALYDNESSPLEASNLSDQGFLPPQILFSTIHHLELTSSCFKYKNQLIDAWALLLTLLSFYPDQNIKHLTMEIINQSSNINHQSLSDTLNDFENAIQFLIQSLPKTEDNFFLQLHLFIKKLFQACLRAPENINTIVNAFQTTLKKQEETFDLFSSALLKAKNKTKSHLISHNFFKSGGYVTTFNADLPKTEKSAQLRAA